MRGAAPVLALALVAAACSDTKDLTCRTSPQREPDEAFEADATGGEAWALPFGPVPVRMDTEWKLVWRMTGEGDFGVTAVDPDGGEHGPVDVTRHEGSNFNRPGEEWGTVWRFPSGGCWTLEAERGDTRATLRIPVVEE